MYESRSGNFMNKYYSCILYLVSYVLHNKKVDAEKIKSMDMEQLLNICKFHSLTVIVAYALESAGIKDKNFQKEKSLAIRNIMLLDAELKQMCHFWDENKIWYMPLKGVYLKDYYPKIGMRQMCDNDILIDPAGLELTDQWMSKRGYHRHDYSNHDYSYLKKPCYNYEIHYALAANYHGHGWLNYYNDIKKKLIRNNENSYEYHFSDEDFYLFMIMHEYKHFSTGGTGLRSLVDSYVYLKKFSDIMDWNYIHQECHKLEIAEFEAASREISLKIFDSPDFPELSDSERKMIEYYCGSGTYGTVSNATIKKMNKFESETGSTSKFKYILSRIFPPMESYRIFYPFFYRHKVLLPVGWAYRLLRGIFCKRNSIKSELNTIKYK